MNDAGDPQRARELLDALEVYQPARQAFLGTLRLPASNRDPLAEFSEQLVCALLAGSLAASRVQPGHDLTLSDDRRVQVRYLANPGGTWVNEHLVHRIPGVHLYALVIFEAFAVVGVLVFPTDGLAPICTALGKQHPHQQEQLQFTRRNWHTIRDDPTRFENLGMRVWLPPYTGPPSRGTGLLHHRT